MTSERAQQKVAEAIGDEQAASDLVEWFNCTTIERSDVARLIRLYRSGLFGSWACPTCDERVHDGRPDDWRHFQGARFIDYVSYPGYGPGDARCDSCRCHMVGEPNFAREGYRFVIVGFDNPRDVAYGLGVQTPKPE